MAKTWKCPKIIVPEYLQDMRKEAHILIGGQTGSGKSVALNGFIYSLLDYAPCQCGFILVDPKGIELRRWRNLPHTISHAVSMTEIEGIILWAEREMESRYAEMPDDDVLVSTRRHIYIVIDEYAALSDKKNGLTRRGMGALSHIAYMGRAANIHIVACTQRPTSDVIDGLIKNNFNCVLGLRTRQAQDSRNLIGTAGCEKTIRGTGFYVSSQFPDPTMVKIPMLSTEQIKQMTDFWIAQKEEDND